ncbi:hypothetical protein Rsub_07681 [Raphidocelis subcapitata]|uniref:Uncharacterized protein n=1 Tax=Raphidocelis subcapitata TaxID=307507 RepID=A0A2V0PD55_9CHLO|nr:hypothetical protein Rsub_07681 [Raphidocelis subcapitata]|eukprot:GBF95097.1 hypothetical protein Rsub_07681 [Raphidocelis subcapitata]
MDAAWGGAGSKSRRRPRRHPPRVAAVHEGAVQPKSVFRSAIGGALLSRAMQSVLARELEGKGSRLMARHMFRRVPIPDFAQYELPDGTELNIGPDRYRVSELLFQSARVSQFPGLEGDPLLAGRQLLSWPALVKTAVDACDAEVRREYWSSIVIGGGTSLLPNSRERLERELTALAPGGVRAKVNAPVNPAEKRFATWIGGSILASLPSFQQCWLSRAEYDEYGAGLIHRKGVL